MNRISKGGPGVSAHAQLLGALSFAADKHRDQRRKGAEASPYINHPIAVAEVLARVGGVSEIAVLQAAVLHDTLEDTKTTREELAARFGETVARIVAEVTDDKSLAKGERKQRQVEHALHLSREAKLVKLGDKICNVRDVLYAPPKKWSAERCAEYVEWARRVVDGCHGTNAALERHFDALVSEARTAGPRRTAGDEPPGADPPASVPERVHHVARAAEVKRALGVDASRDWLRGHYQHANRIASLHFLGSHGVAARLYVYFCANRTPNRTCPADAAGWAAALEREQLHLGIPPESPLRARVHTLHLPVVLEA